MTTPPLLKAFFLAAVFGTNKDGWLLLFAILALKMKCKRFVKPIMRRMSPQYLMRLQWRMMRERERRI